MKRRKLLVGLGSMAGVGGVLGSGAFSSVSAQRDVEVQVAGDAGAFLKMVPSSGPNGTFATTTGNGLIELDFSDTAAGGEGVGLDSTYKFDDVFHIENQGTQTVYVWANFTGGTFDDDDIWFYPDSDPTRRLNDGTNSVVTLPVGERVKIGVHINTDVISSTTDQTLTATLTADVDVPTNSTPSDSVGEDAAVVSKNPDAGEFSSIQNAVDAVDGTTVIVEPGTYEESVTVDVAGIDIRSTQGPGETTVNAGPTHGPTEDTSASGDRNTGAVFTVTASDVTINGFEIKNPEGLIGVKIASGADGTEVLHNEIRDLGPTERLGVSGIATDPGSFEGIRIVGNTIENLQQELGEASQSRPTVNGILFDAVSGSDTLTDAVVRDNTIRDLRSDHAPLGIVLQQQLTNVTVADNTLADIVASHDVDSNPDDDAQGEFTTFAQAINVAASSTTDVQITGNLVARSIRSRDGYYGEAIKIDGSDVSGLSINQNDLLAPFAINNTASGAVDATENFFNSPNGPNTSTQQSSDPDNDERPSAASVVLGPADTSQFRMEPINGVLVSKNLDGRPGFLEPRDALTGNNPKNGATDVNPGEIVFVESGTYSGGGSFGSTPGLQIGSPDAGTDPASAPRANVRVLGQESTNSNARPTIDGWVQILDPGVTFDGFTVKQEVFNYGLAAFEPGVTIRNVTVDGVTNGLFIPSVEDVLVERCTVENYSFYGGLISGQNEFGGATPTVRDTTFDGASGGGAVGIGVVQTDAEIRASTVSGNEVTNEDGAGIAHFSGAGVVMQENRIESNDDGIFLAGPDAATVAATSNDIVNNLVGVANEASSGALPVDATGNWWGSPNGPGANASSNTTGTHGPVDADPWSTEAGPDWNRDGTPGFSTSSVETNEPDGEWQGPMPPSRPDSVE